MTEYEFQPLKVCGSVPTGLIRRAYAEGGEPAALEEGHLCLIDATDEQILKIARSEAEIRGVSPNTEYWEL